MKFLSIITITKVNPTLKFTPLRGIPRHCPRTLMTRDPRQTRDPSLSDRKTNHSFPKETPPSSSFTVHGRLTRGLFQKRRIIDPLCVRLSWESHNQPVYDTHSITGLSNLVERYTRGSDRVSSRILTNNLPK